MTISSYLTALFWTVVIEVAVAWFLKFRKKREIATVLLVNLISHPILHYLFLIDLYFGLIPLIAPVVLVLEVGVVFLEWGLMVYALKERSKRSLFKLSLIMNSVSYLAGILMFFGHD